MNQKKAKQRRRIARYYYDMAIAVWQDMKPPRWRFIAYRKWKKRKPIMPRVIRSKGEKDD